MTVATFGSSVSSSFQAKNGSNSPTTTLLTTPDGRRIAPEPLDTEAVAQRYAVPPAVIVTPVISPLPLTLIVPAAPLPASPPKTIDSPFVYPLPASIISTALIVTASIATREDCRYGPSIRP